MTNSKNRYMEEEGLILVILCLICIVMAFSLYSCCVVAARADDQIEKQYAEYISKRDAPQTNQADQEE